MPKGEKQKLKTHVGMARDVRFDVGDYKGLSYMSSLPHCRSATEMRRNKNVSRASPVAALNHRPTSVRKNPKSKELLPTEFRV